MNSKIPDLYSLIKLHKIDQPIRAIVTSCQSPVHFLAKTLNNIILNKFNINSKFSIKNSI